MTPRELSVSQHMSNEIGTQDNSDQETHRGGVVFKIDHYNLKY